MSNYLKKFLFTFLILGVPYMNSASKAMKKDEYVLDYQTINMNGKTYNLPIARRLERPMDQNYEPIEQPSTISEYTPEMRDRDNEIGRANSAFKAYYGTTSVERYQAARRLQLTPKNIQNAYSAAVGYRPY